MLFSILNVAGRTLLLDQHQIVLVILAPNRKIRQADVKQTQRITSDSLSKDELGSVTSKFPIADPLLKITLLLTVLLVLRGKDLMMMLE